MQIRMAKECDAEGISGLLLQICNIHHEGRPDLFKKGGKKYSTEQLIEIINDENRPVLVAVDENNNVLGYALCILKESIDDSVMTDIKTLYLDDLCVDEKNRGNNIGQKIYNAVIEYAEKIGCYNVTLNVWACNKRALKFYERCGLKPQKIGMEKILK